jgi:hypothetical protein
VKLIALISAYREGPLVHGAIASALQATPHVHVFEGPAGFDNIEGPESDYSMWGDRIVVRHAEWKNDANKRTAMVKSTRQDHSEPTWVVWVDGDEVLRNPELLHDVCQHITWMDEVRQSEDPGAPPTMGFPIRIVELDGGVMICRGKVVRADLIDRYEVSSSVFINHLGYMHAEGNTMEPLHAYAKMLEAAMETDRLFLPHWLLAEPFLLHRSLLRHPARRGVRMSSQELVELEARGLHMPENG